MFFNRVSRFTRAVAENSRIIELLFLLPYSRDKEPV